MRGGTIEVHAGPRMPIRYAPRWLPAEPRWRTPLAHLRQGEQLAWYDSHPSYPEAPGPARCAGSR